MKIEKHMTRQMICESEKVKRKHRLEFIAVINGKVFFKSICAHCFERHGKYTSITFCKTDIKGWLKLYDGLNGKPYEVITIQTKER